jgi:type IV secretory pathway component VirB8
MESREKVMINFMKQYVELRNTYIKDKEEMKKRWMWGGLVSYLSSYSVYQDFAKFYPKLQAEMDAKKASRAVEILSVERSGGEKSYIWKVEFKTYDYTYETKHLKNPNKSAGPEITEKYWTANIGSRADPRRRTSYRRLINPLGFVVYSYFQSEIES